MSKDSAVKYNKNKQRFQKKFLKDKKTYLKKKKKRTTTWA